jgi:hypothetical protein
MPVSAGSSERSGASQVPESVPLDTRSASSIDGLGQAAPAEVRVVLPLALPEADTGLAAGEPALLDLDLAEAMPPPAAGPVAAADTEATGPPAGSAGPDHPHGAPLSLRPGGPAASGRGDAEEVVGATADEQRAAETARLLALGAQALRDDRLTVPAATSAHHYFVRVLAMNAADAEARAGISRIVQRYRQLAAAALRDQAFDRTARYIARGLSVRGDDPGLLALRRRLGETVAQAEADKLAATELARMAARQSRASEPAIESEPAPEINFRTLMRAVD